MLPDTGFLFGTLRVIQCNEGMVIATALDTSNTVALCFRLYGAENKEILFETHMGVTNMEENDPDYVTWLGHVIGRIIRDAYKQGYFDKATEVNKIWGDLTESVKKMYII